MRILSVNVGGLRAVQKKQGGEFYSGIYKTPVTAPVAVSFSGMVGDAQGNLAVHGGPDNAVYAYSAEHYAEWRREEGRDDIGFGTFGDNLTISTLHESQVRIGDIYRAGTALLEVTQPRLPCATLGLRMNDPTFPDRFLATRRTGMYLRVLKEGAVRANDDFKLEEEGTVSLTEAIDILHADGVALSRIEALAADPSLSRRWRDKAEKLLARRRAA